MEIREVKQEKVKYPKINERNNVKLKNTIPNKWMKMGITAFLFNILMQNKLLALEPSEVQNKTMVSAGLYLYEYQNPLYLKSRKICGIAIAISTIVLFITLIKILQRKLLIKITNKKISKGVKILFIISIVGVIISTIGFLHLNYLII